MHRLGADPPIASRPQGCPGPAASNPRTSASRSVSSGKAITVTPARPYLGEAIADAVPGMALVVLHHDRKANSEDFVDSVSGINGIAGAR
jgi:hypothetical protein